MTDNDIIKALECCEGVGGISYCNNCPMYDVDNCVHILSRESLDLINRQKAEIERYKGVIKILENDVKTARAEAIKEFGRFLLDKSEWNYIHIIDIIDYVKEMAGEQE